MGIKLPLTNRIIPIVFDEHVDREFGTGALKVTPSHDRDDYEIGLRHSLERLKASESQDTHDHSLADLRVKARTPMTIPLQI